MNTSLPLSSRLIRHLVVTATGGTALLLAGCGNSEREEREALTETSGPVQVRPEPGDVRAPAEMGVTANHEDLRTTTDATGRTAMTGATTDGSAPTGEAGADAPRVPMINPEAWRAMPEQTAVAFEDSAGLELRIRQHLLESDALGLTERELVNLEIEVLQDRVVLSGSLPPEVNAERLVQAVTEVPRVQRVEARFRGQDPAAVE